MSEVEAVGSADPLATAPSGPAASGDDVETPGGPAAPRAHASAPGGSAASEKDAEAPQCLRRFRGWR
eukprot:2610221-Pyramimonas_sp.AAC.1